MSDLSEANDLDVSFLSHAAAVIKKASDDLAEDNRKAERERKARDWKEFERIVRQFGFCNSVACMANLAEELAGENESDYQAMRDYEQASAVLEAASAGVDLTFGSGALDAVKTRATALRRFKEGAEDIR